MHTSRCLLLPVAIALGVAALAQSSLVIPAAYATSDAVSYLWIPGASRDVRQQTLIGASHLTSLVGRALTALELRRTAANEIYQGGVAQLTVSLSTPPNTPLSCSQAFAANIGCNSLQVFSGTVTLPTSPPETGPAVSWTPANIVRIVFQTPFTYLGGTLCVDVIGHAVAGQNADWWMADAEFEDISGATLEIGQGCGAYGGAQHRWSHVAQRSLLPGAYARFWACGPQYSVGLALFGASGCAIPLPLLGLPAPGCSLYLSTLDAVMLAVFEPEPAPVPASSGGIAEVRIQIPSNPAVLGFTLTTQWLEWSQLAVSNAIQWTIASAIPALDMAVVEGHATELTGEVAAHMAHVMRFEFQ